MSKIIVALDGMDWTKAKHLARSLRGEVWGFKVNDALLDRGVDCIQELKQLGVGVFADPKLHDIPNTVRNATKKLVRAGADIITVHASGGFDMLRAAVEEGGPAIAAVSILTSMCDLDCTRVYGSRSRRDLVEDFALLAQEANVQKLICGVPDLDLPTVKCLSAIVPGIRVEAVANDDQRTGGIPPAGSYTYAVIGRPIIASQDPIASAKGFNELLA